MTPEREAVASQEKRAPVQGYSAGIPWSMHLRAYDAYCKKWGKQPAMIDLEGRNCRGGFSVGELDGFIPGWREELSELTRLRSALATAERERDEARGQADFHKGYAERQAQYQNADKERAASLEGLLTEASAILLKREGSMCCADCIEARLETTRLLTRIEAREGGEEGASAGEEKGRG